MSNRDGGPAFPRSEMRSSYGLGTIDDGAEGMTLRDYFAAKAMQALMQIEDVSMPNFEVSAKYIADRAYEYADSMLAAREAEDE